MDVTIRQTGSGYWNLYVDGKLKIEEESFTIVDQVRSRLNGSWVGVSAEVAEVAAGIEDEVISDAMYDYYNK